MGNHEIDVLKAIRALDEELASKGERYTLYTCGGAALIFLGYSDRATEDIDIIQTEIDPTLQAAILMVAKKLKYESNWLNNEVKDLGNRLGKGWKKKAKVLFHGEGVILKSISRQDLISSKFHALVDRRGADLDDLLFLNPSEEELQIAADYAIAQGLPTGLRHLRYLSIIGWIFSKRAEHEEFKSHGQSGGFDFRRRGASDSA